MFLNNEELLLQKVRALIPFVLDSSKVEWRSLPFALDYYEAHIHKHTCHYGWWEEGLLPLDREGNPVGTITIYYTNKQGKEWNEEHNYPEGEVFYLLSYNVRFNTYKKEEYAFLFKIKSKSFLP